MYKADLAAKIQATSVFKPEAVVNVFIELFGRDYRIEDHFQICWWYFLAQKAGHRDALDLIDNMYNEKKHRVWGKLFGKTDHLIELPPFTGNAYSTHDMTVFCETVAKLGNRLFDKLSTDDIESLIKTGEGKPKEDRLSQSLITSFSHEEVQLINYYSSGYHLPVRYAGAGMLTPTVRSYLDTTVFPCEPKDRAVVDVAVQERMSGEEALVRFPDLQGHTRGLNTFIGEISYARLTNLPTALFINQQVNHALRNELQGYAKDNTYVTAERLQQSALESVAITHKFAIKFDPSGYASISSARSHDQQDGVDVPTYCKTNWSITAEAVNERQQTRDSVKKNMPFYSHLAPRTVNDHKVFNSLNGLEVSLFIAKQAKNITLHR